MKYSLNDYIPYMDEKCVRVEIFPDKETASKIVTDYKAKGFRIAQCCEIMPGSCGSIPSPNEMVAAMATCIASQRNGVVFVGIEAYTVFLNLHQVQDFVRGLRSLVDKQKGCARFLLSYSFSLFETFSNPKYKDSLYVVELKGDYADLQDLSIRLLPQKWIGRKSEVLSVREAISAMDKFVPVGSYIAWISDVEMPIEDYGNVTIVRSAAEALSALYSFDSKLTEANAELLLHECNGSDTDPMNWLIDKFGGHEYLTKEKAAKRLHQLLDDKLWPLYSWMLKIRIPPESYLYQVLTDTDAVEYYWPNYVIHTAIAHLDDINAEVFASERAEVLRGTNDPLIAGFVSETIENDKVIPFLNCESDFEMVGLIHHAAHYDLDYGMPAVIQRVAPILGQYLSPNYDYGFSELSDYFSKLRCFRMRNMVDEKFVRRAYSADVPKLIKKRSDVIAGYDDGKTALLVVDGMGAEYYPLLLAMATQNGINIAEKQLVCASLPSSTQFNHIPWSSDRRLQEVKRADTISHTGYSAHEKSTYEDNLAEILRVFRRDIFPRIMMGLKNHERVLVTADHGASYLAVLAHKSKMNMTLPWNGIPDDWRYSALSKAIATPDGMLSDYHAAEQKTYYIVKGYNRLPKEGGKEYALHGGATLEEILVPLVVFTKNITTKPNEEPLEQLIENDDFDLL